MATTSRNMGRRTWNVARSVGAAAWLLGAIGLAGCSSSGPTTQPTTISDRQDQALRDPFGYNPDFNKPDRTVSGENDPDGLKKDLHDVLNP